ncbi:MAG: DNRLRE domain-containing protein [Bacteroidota bacterium]
MKNLIFLTTLFCFNVINTQVTYKLKPGPQKGKDSEIAFASIYDGITLETLGLIGASAWTWSGEASTVHTVIDFDWSLLPQDAVVSSASIKFFAFNGDGGSQEFHSTLSGSNESWLHRITQPWNESTMNNQSAPLYTDLNRVALPATDSINQDFEIDVTQLVNDMLQNPTEGFGFYWKLQNEQYYRRLGFCSSDNSDPSKWPEIKITFEAPGVIGKVFNDLNGNCLQENNELDLAGRLIEIQPGNFIAQTNEAGIWHINLPLGNYTATLINSDANWSSDCSLTSNFSVIDINASLTVPSFSLKSDVSCSSPNISIYSNILRRCFSEQEIYVQASNSFQASSDLNDAYAEITLDPLFTLDSASISYIDLGDNLFKFNLDTLSPNESVNFTLYVTLSCDAVLLQTLCHEAKLYPVESCVLDSIPSTPTGEVSPCTLPWDKSSLVVDGWCENDSIYFTITNHGQFGEGDMDCYAPVRVYIDGELIVLDSIKLVGGEVITYAYAGTGQTWILQADQHPLHPGNSHPNAHVENCGSGTWTPGIITDFPVDDADPVVDIFCSVTNGSYDPNDKRGFPSGLTENNYILPNQELEYIVRFQNTGTDTAFTVVIRDTLDTDLDISQVVTANASHNYSFKIYGQRILEWRFDNILLVDSTTNEAGSHGFIQFSVKQKPNLPDFTIINNEADIYFDFNEAVITNNTSHVINRGINEVLNSDELELSQKDIQIYPNPTENTLFVISDKKMDNMNFELSDLTGKTILKGRFKSPTENTINLSEIKNGLYILTVFNTIQSEQFKVLKK